MENIDFSYFSNRASFMGNPVRYPQNILHPTDIFILPDIRNPDFWF